MKLYSSPTSPFVRKVRIVIREKGAAHLVTEEVVSALADPASLHAANPLGKVPALALDDGLTFFDSPLICEYLDATLEGPSLLPPSGDARWQAQRLHAIGDGIADAAVSLTFEKARPEAERSANWMGRWRRAITRSLDLLEAEAASLEGAPTLGTIAVESALGYLDFRHGDLSWREGRPALAAVFEKASGRPAFRETAPA
ncbi:MAG: glutathione S-transferase N-terminal domain-containing protein [Parvibaculum sp.]|uniref:glutathione S-transferase N-terminal domain-containing protein n=1 Tax=Parvibaculum sp. TaxID=2024848 RepID=UPI0025D35AEE|nr:glutathione S-transferase N-terminal domain-containing protein [Parvibaculum sp.]MCE9649085.1 glutathione S-transferase N-terminal domain-containing protein [Parvibaculum sp.]